jgi:hypothetical protein
MAKDDDWVDDEWVDDKVTPQAAAQPKAPQRSGLEKLLRGAATYANGYTGGLSTPAAAMAGAVGDTLGSAVGLKPKTRAADYDESRSVFDKPDDSLLAKVAGQDFAGKVEAIKGEQRKFQGEHPALSAGAEIAGAVSPGSIPGKVFGAAQKATGLLPGAGAKGIAKFARDMVVNPMAGSATGAASQEMSNLAEQASGSDSSELPSVGRAAAIGGVIPAATTAASGVLKGANTLARSAARMTKGQARAYTQDPKGVEALYEAKYGDAPDYEKIQGVANDNLNKAKGGLRESGDALRTQRNLEAKPVRMAAEQLKNTGVPAVDEELSRLKAMQPQPQPRTVKVPVEDAPAQPGTLQEFLGKTRDNMAKGRPLVKQNQGINRANAAAGLESENPLKGLPWQEQEARMAGAVPSPQLPQGGSRGQSFNNYQKLEPKTAQFQEVQVPREAPSHMTLTGPQALRLRSTVQANQKFLTPSSPMDPRPGAPKELVGLGQALQKGIHGAAPATAPLDQQIGQKAHLADEIALRFKRQPSRALESSSTDIRALAQKLDREGGSDLVNQALRLDAAKSMKPSGIIPDISKALGRVGLRGTSAVERGTEGLGDKSLLSILGLLREPKERK